MHDFFLMSDLLSQGVIDVPSVRLLVTDSPLAAQRHQLIRWISIFLQDKDSDVRQALFSRPCVYLVLLRCIMTGES